MRRRQRLQRWPGLAARPRHPAWAARQPAAAAAVAVDAACGAPAATAARSRRMIRGLRSTQTASPSRRRPSPAERCRGAAGRGCSRRMGCFGRMVAVSPSLRGQPPQWLRRFNPCIPFLTTPPRLPAGVCRPREGLQRQVRGECALHAECAECAGPCHEHAHTPRCLCARPQASRALHPLPARTCKALGPPPALPLPPLFGLSTLPPLCHPSSVPLPPPASPPLHCQTYFSLHQLIEAHKKDFEALAAAAAEARTPAERER